VSLLHIARPEALFMDVSRLFDWFSGGRPGYMPLFHCMNHDTLWVAITVALDVAVAAGYALIAKHWWINERGLAAGGPKEALSNLKRVFLFCGICGYLFIPIKMIWPAWRLYDFFLGGLVFYTWRFAWSARHLKVVYQELGRSAQLEEDLETSRAESRRKSFFLNAVSHDIRTPLNGLTLQSELAALHLESNDVEGLREALAEIKAGARVTASLLDHFMEMGRLDWSTERMCILPFDLGEALEAIRVLHHSQAEKKGIGLELSVPSGLVVRSDRSKLDRIAMNLVSNALKFTEAGKVSIRAGVDGPDAIVTVEDSGTGIAAEHQGRIFDEFFQVNNGERDRNKGFGLGLAIARRLARQLGGDLSLESEPGRGSRFQLRLPGAALAGSEPSHSGRGERGASA